MNTVIMESCNVVIPKSQNRSITKSQFSTWDQLKSFCNDVHSKKLTKTQIRNEALVLNKVLCFVAVLFPQGNAIREKLKEFSNTIYRWSYAECSPWDWAFISKAEMASDALIILSELDEFLTQLKAVTSDG